MGLSTSVLTALNAGINHLPDLARHLGRDRRAVVKAVQTLKRRGLAEIVAADAFDRVFSAQLPATAYVLTAAGQAHAAAGLAISPGQGERPRRRTAGLRERAWWELRAHGLASLKQIITTHAEGTEKAAHVNLYKYLCALEQAGILTRAGRRLPARQSKGWVQWHLARDLGPKAPVWRGARREVFDPNSGRAYPIGGAEEGGHD